METGIMLTYRATKSVKWT